MGGVASSAAKRETLMSTTLSFEVTWDLTPKPILLLSVQTRTEQLNEENFGNVVSDR